MDGVSVDITAALAMTGAMGVNPAVAVELVTQFRIGALTGIVEKRKAEQENDPHQDGAFR